MRLGLGQVGLANYFCRRMQSLHHTSSLPAFPAEHAHVVYHAVNELGGDVRCEVSRVERTAERPVDDLVTISYITLKKETYLQLRYCVSGNMYCRQNGAACHQCRAHEADSCRERIETIDEVSISFSKTCLSKFFSGNLQTLSDTVLAFQQSPDFSRSLALCNRSKVALQQVLSISGESKLAALAVSTASQQLLLYALEALDEKVPQPLTCRFLNNEADRAKILLARDILLQQIGEPVTIKQLSRRVAMNECYLKKGFKEVFGATIFEFYQDQRMQHARYLLYEKGLTVTEVAEMLGYSSISHFSTAFKKHTGLKPCELLLRS